MFPSAWRKLSCAGYVFGQFGGRSASPASTPPWHPAAAAGLHAPQRGTDEADTAAERRRQGMEDDGDDDEGSIRKHYLKKQLLNSVRDEVMGR